MMRVVRVFGVFMLAVMFLSNGQTCDMISACHTFSTGRPESYKLRGAAGFDASFTARPAPNCGIEVRLDPADDASPGTTWPVPFELTIGGQTVSLLHPETLDPVAAELAESAPTRFAMDELTLPTEAPGIYDLRLSGPDGIEPFSAQVKVGCTDERFASFVACAANCGRWEVRW